MKHCVIIFRTTLPDYSDILEKIYDLEKSVYGSARETKPHDAPIALGKPIILTHYVDINLYHDMITGRSVTGILHFINQTPVKWLFKKQENYVTTTYRSECVAARTYVEQIIYLRITLRYLGVPTISPSYMLGDNESVVDSSMIFLC